MAIFHALNLKRLLAGSRSVEYLTVAHIPSFENILISFRTSLLLAYYTVRIFANMNGLAFRLATYKTRAYEKKKEKEIHADV